jgi:hypothetical protein
MGKCPTEKHYNIQGICPAGLCPFNQRCDRFGTGNSADVAFWHIADKPTRPRLSAIGVTAVIGGAGTAALDRRISDVRIIENGFATSSGVSKSAKVVLVRPRQILSCSCVLEIAQQRQQRKTPRGDHTERGQRTSVPRRNKGAEELKPPPNQLQIVTTVPLQKKPPAPSDLLG